MSDTFEDAIQFKLQMYKKRAAEKGREFSVPHSHFKRLVLSDCSYCGLKAERGASFKYAQHTFRSNGLDRRDSSLGYTLANVLPCCAFCNAWKGDEALASWLERIHRIAERTAWFPERLTPPAEPFEARMDRDRARWWFKKQMKD